MRTATLALALRLAFREIRGGVRGFRVFLACLALGVGGVAATGASIDAFDRGLTREARAILGGDVEARLSRRLAEEETLARLSRDGRLAKTFETRTMARAGDERRLVELRAVDAAFPLVGAVRLDPPIDLAEALAGRDETPGLVAEDAFFKDFDAKLGDRVNVAGHDFILTARIVEEPDRLALGFALGPRVLAPWDALAGSDLTRPGSLFRASYRILFDETVAAESATAALKADFENERVRIRDLDDAATGVRGALEQLESFLTVAGLGALIAGGLGVFQAVESFVASRAGAIATLKALGASKGLIRTLFAGEIAALAALGGLIGVGVGALAPLAIKAIFGDALPLPVAQGPSPAPLAFAFAQGLLAAGAFCAPAVGRARTTPTNALFRDGSTGPRRGARPWPEYAASAVFAAGFVALAVLGGGAPMTTLALLGGSLIAFAALFALAKALMFLVRRFGARPSGAVRIALANLSGPRSIAPITGPALGLGLAVVTTVTLIQTNLVRQIRETAPETFPSLFVREIPANAGEAFDALVAEEGASLAPDAYRRAPFLSGRIVTLKGEPLDLDKVAPSERWIANGETGLTYQGSAPPELALEKGDWWPADYSGPPLVSLEGDAARGLGLEVGDKIGIDILGRVVEAEVANLRTIDWGGFGLNFAIVFAPGALEGAGARQVAVLKVDRAVEDLLARAVGDAFPGTSVIRARQAFEAAADVLEDIALALTAGAGIVAAAGLLVLIGAAAAAGHRRRGQLALLRTLGAGRGAAIGIMTLEFTLTGLAAAAGAVGIAILAARPVVVGVFEAVWILDPMIPLGAFALSAGACGLAGLIAGRMATNRPPARILRAGG